MANHGLHGTITPGGNHGTPTVDAAARLKASGVNPSAGPTSSADLVYHNGGPVMHSTTTYLIFWEPGTAVIQSAVKQLEAQFLGDLGGPFYNIMNQYYDTVGGGRAAIDPLSTYGGSWDDTTNAFPTAGTAASPITDSAIQQEVVNAINANPNWVAPGLNTLYEVVLGQGVEFCEADGVHCTFATGNNGLCAYHGSFSDGGTPVIYANDGNDAGRRCSLNQTSPNDRNADADVSTMSHETFEAITDPEVNTTPAWYTPVGVPGFGGQEIGDLCAYNYGAVTSNGTNLTMGSHQYQVQREWSNTKADANPTTEYGGCDVLSGAIEAASSHPACTANQLAANDDGSTSAVALPFTANFFSQQFNSLYVNNNGNVTFDGPQVTYTPYGLLATTRQIIAPFFADVDTRGAGSQLVTYGSDTAHNGQPAYFCVDWINVGYYNSHTDKFNSFQLVLTDRSAATGVPGDFDIEFNYDKIQWETGDASGGVNGFGGTPAVVGYSNGTTQALQLPGSATSGAFEDNGPNALTQGSQNSTITGRYIYPVRNGTVPTGGAVHGTVTRTGGAAVSGAEVEVCSITTNACSLTTTNSGGGYSVTGLTPDSYSVIVNPPSGSSLNPGYALVTVPANGDVQADIVLTGPQPPPSNVTVQDTGTNPDGLPVLIWTVPSNVSVTGCAGGTASAVVTFDDGTTITVPMPEGTPAGTYNGTIPAVYPHHGNASVLITVNCPNPSQNQSIPFDIYIDPSGTVVDQHGAPIAGATVTLLRSDAQGGPFAPVPDGSSIMSPANRSNPMTTGADGRFDWDVLTGYYEISASAPGCADPADSTQSTVTSAPFAVPPPMTNLTLTLSCGANAGGKFTALGPVRLLDTRNGTGAPAAKVGAGQHVSLQITGHNGVPASGVTAVALNVTVTGPSAGGYLTVYPDGVARPTTSNLNFSAGQTIPNFVIVPVGADGKVDIYNSAGSTNIVADLFGYYTNGSGSSFTAAGPVRLLDTRNGTGAPAAKVGAGQHVSLQITGHNGVPASGVTAVALNVTVTGPSAGGYLTVYPDGVTRPTTSNLNFSAGQTIPNFVIVPVGADGKVDIYNSAGSTNIVADLFGYYSNGSGSSFTAAGPVRLLDTRNGTGAPAAKVGAGQHVSLQITGHNGVPASGVTAVALNVTVTGPSAGGYLTVYPDGVARPTTSNLNFSAGQTIPNFVIVPVGADGKVDIYNSAGTVNIVADLFGFYTS